MTGAGLIVDLFAGGGGASCGIEAALGRDVDIAINHDVTAMAVHKANHPGTLHLEADIWEVRPQEAVKGRPVELLWASPDCTHFSVAKGGKPRKKNIRSLAWAVVRWADAVSPQVIILENVTEFLGWGPLNEDGRPNKQRMGSTFMRWKRRLERLGYVVDFRILDASLFGAPTRRRRLFIIARRDGLPIQWPVPTHGAGRLPLHTAAECIDWSIPCPSIFERKKPLAEKTLWRIAQGIRRFVLENPAPFVITIDQGGSARTDSSIDAPIPTVVTKNRTAVVIPHLSKFQENSIGQDAREPLHTVMAGAPRFGVVAPSLIKVNHGVDRKTGRREHSLEAPLATVTAGGRGDALISPTLMQVGYGEREGQAARLPGLDKPLGTVVAGGRKHALVSGFLAKHFGGVVGLPMEAPVGTVTARDHHALAAATLVKMRGECAGSDIAAPAPTITAGGFHIAQVRAFLTTYYGEGSVGQRADSPMRTVTAKHRLGLVTIEGNEYQIVDICMRMLEPHELLRAQFGRYAAGYSLEPATTKAAKVRLIGNSVCPEVAEAVVRANLPAAAQAIA